MTRRLIFFLLLLSLLAPLSAQQANPFTGGPPTQRLEAARSEGRQGPPGGSSFSLWLSRTQGELQQQMSGFIRALNGERSTLIWSYLLGLGVLYGVVHTLLPGHRKTVLFSYFLTEDATPWHGVVAGFSLGLLHVATAVAIVVGSYRLIEVSINAAISEANFYIQQASAWLIVVLGSLFLIAKVRHLFEHRHHAHGEHGGEHHADAHGEHYHAPHAGQERAGRRRNRLSLPAIILSGLVPCPGSTVVLLFSLSLGVLSVGIATVAAISLGMAVTLSALAVATILLKRTILEQEGRFGHFLHHGVEIGAAAFMLLFGVALVLAPPV